MRIMFMGTPEIAATCLSRLVADGHGVVACVTGEDKPRGRGKVMTPTPVKALALELGIPVYTPRTLRDEAFLEILRVVNPDLIAVVAYGKILPPAVLDFPKYGCINAHVSLLPKYRGAAPMQRAIMNGEEKTGVTIMYMDVGLDTGDMLLREELPIDDSDNFETIHDKLGALGASLIVRTLDALKKGECPRIPQEESGATYAAKITKEDCLIDFSQSARAVHNQIRGLSPIPLSFTHTPDGKLLKVTRAQIREEEAVLGEPGLVLSTDDGITVACGRGALTILGVLPEGKPRMSASDFVRGRKIGVGDLLK